MATTSQSKGANPGDDQTSTASTRGMLSNLLPSFKTTGTKNIEAAYSRAGGHNNHLPGHASKLGSQDQAAPSEHQGVGSEEFKDRISDQRAEPSMIGKAFNNMINGTDSTK